MKVDELVDGEAGDAEEVGDGYWPSAVSKVLSSARRQLGDGRRRWPDGVLAGDDDEAAMIRRPDDDGEETAWGRCCDDRQSDQGQSGDGGFAGDEEGDDCHCQDGEGITVGDCVPLGLKEIDDDIILGRSDPPTRPHSEGGRLPPSMVMVVLHWYIAFCTHAVYILHF
ncbi:hypothetical protein ACLOJK_033955 [Asimina triloba]